MAGAAGRAWPCGVCRAAGAKYRCPRCAAAYCSVPCCRTHKERCTPEPKREQERAAAGQCEPNRAGHLAGSPWSVEDILTEDDEQDRVPQQKLKLLGESEELQGLLLNPHLRQLLLTLDQAEDKSSLMKKHMQEPLFVEFADCCLRIVEPLEKENILPE
ncbi:zinc finger HIT domain-containing protein 3 isoform X2 [Dryobates pubescens]|uniref:zinc finger HIT domain-containing protein 3 isoform X2 n=1 Tax=Dryobates pubescens TaxID=118200 RepID=UPI0023B95342|nr:zinc finger HIT domain-containing protein 3 isoform X2 [Dryobates pubescens]